MKSSNVEGRKVKFITGRDRGFMKAFQLNGSLEVTAMFAFVVALSFFL